MAQTSIANKSRSLYAGSCLVLTTKHQKSLAIAGPFEKILGASVLEYVADTDLLGTFSGDVPRVGTILETVRKKCEWSLKNTKAEHALANEGSFGPHPSIPFLPCDHEVLYFIDLKLDFHLHMSVISEKTNYNMQSLDSMEELQRFAKKTLFPTHALIVRPDDNQHKKHIFKGINTANMLKDAFQQAMKRSTTGKVWVETDMRANMNPTRMFVIEQLAEKLANRLAALCDKCGHPGWGKTQIAKGLECENCGSESELCKAEIYGCVKCDHRENMPPSHNLLYADPANCSYCNP